MLESQASIVLSGERDSDLARQPWNLAAGQLPWSVALPESADDVAAIVELARPRNLRIAPQGTGHGALSLARWTTRSS
jgi:FAD/FMN-containing dehydrogenase